MATLTIGDVVLHAGLAGLSQFYLDKGGLKGWDDVPNSKSEVRERPQADGAFGIEVDWRESLMFSAEGWYSGADRLDARAARRALRGSLSLGKSVQVALDDADGRFRRYASIRGVSIPDSGASPVFTFAIDMVATDPRMYGDDIVQITGVPVSGGGLKWPLGSTPSKFWDWGANGSSGRVTVTNPGEAETFPQIEISGGLGGGFIVTDQTASRSIRFDRVIPLGSTVVVNQRTGRVQIDGQSDVSGFLTTRDFFSIGPAESHVLQFSPLGAVTGTPQMTVRTPPAY
jgi:hypothetical protein